MIFLHHRDTEFEKVGNPENRNDGKAGPMLHQSNIPFSQGVSLCLRGEIIVVLALFFFLVSGCAGKKGTIKEGRGGGGERFRIAVLPFENLSGTLAPLKEMRTELIAELRDLGFDVLDEETLEKMMARHRIRYVGGIDQATAQAFMTEAGVKGVLITSLEMYFDSIPPKIAMTSRLVSTGEQTEILWVDGVGMAGDDSPGVLGLGLIENPEALLFKALRTLSDSLAKYVWNGEEPGSRKGKEKRFEPKIAYRSPEIGLEKKYTIAVIPFFNMTDRKYVGEVVVLQFVRELANLHHFDVLELGMVRQRLLNARIILEGGITLSDVDFIANSLEADFVMTGKVIDYQDFEGWEVVPKIDFFVQIFDRKNRKIVWSSYSHNRGDDGVFFFDCGRINTAHVMMGRMVQMIGKEILEEKKETPPPEPEIEPPPRIELGP
jgi:TolB-like protein